MSPTLPSVPWGSISPLAENHCHNHSSGGMDPGPIRELYPLEPVEAPGRHCQRPRKPCQRTMPCAADGSGAGSLSEAGDEKTRRGTGGQERKPLGGGVGLEVSCVTLGKFLDLSEMQSSRPKSEITTCRVEVWSLSKRLSWQVRKNENQKLPQYRAYLNKSWYVHGTEDYVAIKTNEVNVFLLMWKDL